MGIASPYRDFVFGVYAGSICIPASAGRVLIASRSTPFNQVFLQETSTLITYLCCIKKAGLTDGSSLLLFYVNPYPVAYDLRTPEEFFEAIRNRDETF